MIVVDASVVLELLRGTPAGRQAEARLFQPGETLHAPARLDLEVLQVLRRFAAAGELKPARAHEAVEDLAALPITRHPHALLIARIWELRRHVTAYDAAYLALGEALGAIVLTRDAGMAHARCRTRVEMV